MTKTKLTGKAQTVLGSIDADSLGVTLPHEHLLWDLSLYFVEPSEVTKKGLAHQPVSLENLYWVRYHPLSSPDNLRQLDEQVAVEEATFYRQAGGNTIVEISNVGIGRDPAALARVARATGLNIIMGAGYYVQAAQLPGGQSQQESGLETKTEEEIADEIVRDVTLGVGNSGVRAGIIGEIGCSWPWVENERKSIRAAVSAQHRTGAPLTIHPGRNKLAPFEIIEVLKEKGADLSRVIFNHVERTLFEVEDMCRLAETGCYLEFDLFGSEGYPQIEYQGDFPNDERRVRLIAELTTKGYLNQILLSHDICYKMRLVRYGGHGYSHILRNVVSLMKHKGISDAHIHTMLVENPKDVLQFAEVTGN